MEKAKLSTRNFSAAFLRELAYESPGAEVDVDNTKVTIAVNEIQGTSRWTTNHRLVFQCDGVFYETSYRQAATENQDEKPFDGTDTVDCVIVMPRKVEIIEYVPYERRVIGDFRGAYRWLSNFWTCAIVYDGDLYLSTEHAYQAAKTPDRNIRKEVMRLSCADARRWGQKILLRSDWEEVKLQVMMDVNWFKFASNDALKRLLLETEDAELVENNNWSDRYWGVCNGVGENNLGKILMQIRDELRKQNV